MTSLVMENWVTGLLKNILNSKINYNMKPAAAPSYTAVQW